MPVKYSITPIGTWSLWIPLKILAVPSKHLEGI